MRHPIRVVTRRTGLTAAVLRAWERRYGAVVPQRSEGGQRLYSDEDVRRLLLLRETVEAGRNISHVATLNEAELEALIREDRDAVRVEVSGMGGGLDAGEADAAAEVTAHLNAGERAVEDMDAGALERALYRAALHLTPSQLLDGVLVPLLRRIGERWKGGTLGPASEHVATGSVRRFLEWFIRARAGEGGPLVLVGTPTGQVHELGALLAGATAAAHGWRVLSLGADLPGGEMARAVRRTGASAVALSILLPMDGDALRAELAEVSAGVPPGTFLLVGGGGIGGLEAVVEECGAIYLPDLPSFRKWLGEQR